MDGIATFTIVASSRIMNAPASTTASDTQRRGSAVSSCAPQVVVSVVMAGHRSALAVGQQFRQPRQKLVVPGDLGLQAKNLVPEAHALQADRKSTRLNSSHSQISYAV